MKRANPPTKPGGLTKLGTQPQLPPMQRTLPAALYRDPATYARERTTVFAAGWQFLGHETEALAPGDYIAGDAAGWPVLAVRGKDGVLRGFHNVCRHCAGPLVTEQRGSCGAPSISAPPRVSIRARLACTRWRCRSGAASCSSISTARPVP